jgi:DNA-binding XRE family transcriptional regulator
MIAYFFCYQSEDINGTIVAREEGFPMSDEPSNISRRLRSLRMVAGMTQQQLATASGLSLSLVAQIEQGTTGDPKMSTATALARALGVSLDELAGMKEGTNAPSAEDMPPAQHKPRGRKARRPRGG